MMQQQKRFIVLLMVGFITLLAMGTILAKDHKGGGGGNGDQTVEPSQGGNNGNGNNGNGNGNGNGGNQGSGGQGQPQPQTSEGLLGCQKNNPSRLDCSSLEVRGVCEGDIAVFTIRNTGEAGNGDMLAPTQYRLVVDGVVVETGSIQLSGGATSQITYSGGGTVTLEADQQIGHPGNSHPRVTLDCGAPGATATPEPTATPTMTIEAPVLSAEVFCVEDGSILFIITNSGGNMLEAAAYSVTDSNGGQVDSGYVQLFTGEQFPLQYWGYTSLTLTIGDLIVVASPECVPPTPNPTEEVTPTLEPTEEVTPTPEPTEEITPTPVDTPVLVGNVYCQADGSILFIITNTGADMLEAAYYFVVDPNGTVVADGWLQLFTGESATLQYWGYTRLTFVMGDLMMSQYEECIPPTPVPTEEVTPTAEPTEEFTPTPEPTSEVTPTAEPTITVTPDGTPGCQKNNDGRLDCSSLQVSGTCQDGVAVFTIRNTGERGNGDMLSPTEYRILVDGVVVESGTVQLIGNSAMQITYSGAGAITLEADQQTGHPGKSQPQATVNCSA